MERIALEDERTPVLYLAPWVDLGGSDKGTIDWFKHIDRERWAPSLITTQPSANRWLAHVDPWAEEVWNLPDLMPGAEFPGFILGFIQSRGIRVLHIMNSRLAFDLLPDISNLEDPPVVVVQLHAEEPDRSGYVRYVSTRYANLVDAFSVTSRQLAAAIRDYDVPASRITVIPTGVDAREEFDPARVEALADLDGDGPRVLWPGRLVEQKDPMLTLEVVRVLHDRGVRFTLHLVGDGHLEPALRSRADELGIADLLRWHPPSTEMARWYRSADVLLMTSVFEGVPYVIYEALAMGVPVVAPALPGNVEFMDHDSGALVDPRDDVLGYADALEALLVDEARRREAGRRSRERMLREFPLEEMGRAHDELYLRLLERRSAAAVLRKLPGRAGAEGEDAPAAAPAPLRLHRTPAPERSVAVIVPCYQHGRYLPACLESIRRQTLAPAQIIVVDDHSEDPETVEALAALEHDEDLVVLRQPENLGPSAARNRALEEVRATYVLPLDADDLLLPRALEVMLEHLERADPDVAFVYPHAQHFGNRHDFVTTPAYNLHLLMRNNYCPAPSLFDRRAFDAGVAYPEDVLFGHEDWDLVLQLAERGLRGEHAREPTFLYRKRGFSRVNAVEYGPELFTEIIERRHPSLYGDRSAVKARWAPALSVLLLDGPDEAWSDEAAAGLGDQSCRDFEVLTGSGGLEGLEARVVAPGAAPLAWLAAALPAARGRFVLVATPRLGAMLTRRELVEQLLRALWSSDGLHGVVVADAPAGPSLPFAQLPAAARAGATPCAVAWARPPEREEPWPVELGATASPIEDLVLALQATAPLGWRALHAAPRPSHRAAASAALALEAP